MEEVRNGAGVPARPDPASLLYILAGVSLGISMAMAPSPSRAGSASLLILVALGALLDGLLSRRATSARAGAGSLRQTRPSDTAPWRAFLAPSLLVVCLFAFYFIVINAGGSGGTLWFACGVFAMAAYLWRDLDFLAAGLAETDAFWSRKRIVAVSFGLAPALYYFVYGMLGLGGRGFWPAAAAIFHSAAILLRRGMDGPLAELVAEPDERAVIALLQDAMMAELVAGRNKGAESYSGACETGKSATGMSCADAGTAGQESAFPKSGSTQSSDSDESSAGEPSAGESPSDEEATGEARADRASVTLLSPARGPVETRPLSPGHVDRLAAGLEAWEDGRELEAIDIFLKLVQERPDVEEPNIWAVQLVWKQGLVEQARDLLVEFLRRRPDSYAGFFQLGRLLAGTGKPGLAGRAFRKAARLDPSAAAPWREMAKLAASKEEYAEAAGYAEEALKRDARDRWSREFVEEMKGLEKRRRLEGLRERARRLLAGGRKGEALVMFREIARADPTDIEARLRSARVLLDDGVTDEATAVFEQAVGLPFEAGEGHELPVELVDAYLERGETGKAEAEIERCLLHFRGHEGLLARKVDILVAEDRRDELSEMIENVESGGDAGPGETLAAVYALLEGERIGLFDAAVVDGRAAPLLERVRTSLSEGPGRVAPAVSEPGTGKVEARLYEMDALLAARQGRLDDAVDACERTLSLDGRSVPCREMLAAARRRKRQYSRAVLHYRFLAELEPGVLHRRREQLRCLRMEAEARDAVEEYFASVLLEKRQALLEDPASHLAAFELGLALAVFGRDVSREQGGCGALHYFRIALAADGDNPWYLLGMKDCLLSPIGGADGSRRAETLLVEALGRAGDRQGPDKASRLGWAMVNCELGDLLMSRKERVDASRLKDYYEAALSLRPGLADALYGLGRLAVLDDDHDAAAGYFRRAVRMGPFSDWAAEAGRTMEDIG